MVKFTLAWAICWACCVATLSAQPIPLAGTAKFFLGDNEDFKSPDFDDRQWQTVNVPSSWSSYGLQNYTQQYGWYRIRFSAPQQMVGKASLLFAGQIDDADETYLNGVKIGSSGKFPPNDQSAWDAQRKYNIPAGLLKTDNVLAIRVYNGILDAGLYGGKLFVTTPSAYNRYLKKKIASLHSYTQFTTSNGLVAAVYNESSDQIEAFYPHIFAYHDSAKVVQPVLKNLRHNLQMQPKRCRYLQNTHIIEVDYGAVVLHYFCAFTRADKALYVRARGPKAMLDSLAFKYERGDGTVLNGVQSGDAEKYFVFTFTDDLHSTPILEETLKQLRGRQLVEAETAYMRNVISKCHLPKQLSAAKRNTAEQSIAILKMAQVAEQEIYPLSHGQVLASLRPGVWAISWVRDAAYAIEAMSKVGMYEEAKKGLLFMLNASPTSQYVRYVHTDGVDYGIGVPYLISVTRYFGNGREESDFAPETGPNIELDDFGLFLIAFCQYVLESNDRAFFQAWQERVRELVAIPIMHNLDAQHLLRRDSGPWEHHLPGRQYAFTNGVCARGLQLFADLQDQFGTPDKELSKAVQEMTSGIDRHFLVDKSFYKGNAQEKTGQEHYFFDAATFELFACGLVNDKALFQRHMAVYDQHLRAAKDPARGYIRFDSQDSYENQEWPFAGLRVAVAALRFGDRRKAKHQIDRITKFANRNNNQVPEIIGLEELDYRGAIPMAGYGAGAYLLAILAYYKS